jgi:glycogen debranching enzyme
VLVDVIPRVAEESTGADAHFDHALELLARSYAGWTAECAAITTDNEVLNLVIRRSLNDIRTLLTHYETGPYPVAGVPWFAVPFGRDGVVVGCQMLMVNPEIARGVLRYLAAHQGTQVNRAREEEPGKVMHEMRFGELAGLRQIPHTPYFGSVDATPLFLVLLVELMKWQWDLELFAELEPAVHSALAWLDSSADLDHDGMLEYRGGTRRGIRNQGWKDSHDSMSHQDGSAAPVPAALVEVQGYAVHAWSGLAGIFAALGRRELARGLHSKAETMRQRLEAAFWIPELGFYAQALDRDKRQVTAVSSNPGHLLWSHAIPADRARQVARRLLAPDMFTGWGIRTLSTTAPTYNPMSYHNGSVWPHDNSIIADGMRRYGLDGQALTVATACLEAAMRLPGYHLPELFCGFDRDGRFDSRPAEYLVSARPQAWGAAAVLHLLQMTLGLSADARNDLVGVAPLRTRLYESVRVEHLPVAGRRVSFEVGWGRDGAARVRSLGRSSGVRVELRHGLPAASRVSPKAARA